MKRIIWTILLCAVLSGCVGREISTQNQPRVVTHITAEYNSGTIRLQRNYTNSDKMRSVLNYFRMLSPYGTAQQLPLEGNRVQITVHFSDGSSKLYEQFADTYLRQDGGTWQYIDPQAGQQLPLLLGLMESDG